jgi:hypothetical protein
VLRGQDAPDGGDHDGADAVDERVSALCYCRRNIGDGGVNAG